MTAREIVIRFSAMGDILLTVPALRAMSAREAEVHLVIHQRWQAIAEFLPAKVHFFSGTGSLIKLAAELRNLNAEAVFDLQGKIGSVALRNLVNAPITRTYQKRSLNEQFQAMRGKYPLRFYDQRPVWQKYATICGVGIEKPDPSLILTDEYLKQSRELLTQLDLSEKKFIALHPHASNPGKELQYALIEQLVRQSDMPVVLFGIGERDFMIKNCIDLRNQLGLNSLPGFLRMAAGVISSDSGPMHLARAVDTPLAAVFLQTCPSLGFTPVDGTDILIISRDHPCKPCSLHGQNETCPEGHFKCRLLPPEETARQILDFLNSRI